MSDFHIAFYNDSAGLVTQLKNLRWDVVKWNMTANTALAVAAGLGKQLSETPDAVKSSVNSLFWVALLISLASLALIHHYNWRLMKSRDIMESIRTSMKDNFADQMKGLEAKFPDNDKGYFYNMDEVIIFFAIVLISPFLVILAA